MIFIKSYLDIIKKITFKVNYIIKNENINYVDENTYKKFQYPSISNEDSLETVIAEINEVEKLIKEKIDINKKIDNTEISQLLKQEIKKTFNLHNNIAEIDLLFQNNNDNSENGSFIADEKYEIGQEETDADYEKIKNHFIYIVHLINKKNNNYNNTQYNKTILEKIIEALKIKENNILLSCNNIASFINTFIKNNSFKTEPFSELSPKNIRETFPEIKKLYEYKLLIDGFIRKKCKIPGYKINYKYNFIIPNLTLINKRNNEIYNAPYGWWGVALNINDNYNDNSWLNKDSKEWAICYYGFDYGKHFDTDIICNILYNIIINNHFPDKNFNIKSTCDDIRKKGKKIGVGYYLSPYIDIAEKYSGIISFNNRRYKIALMAKVLISKIKEPEDRSFWVVDDKNNIRIYRILFKEFRNKRRNNY